MARSLEQTWTALPQRYLERNGRIERGQKERPRYRLVAKTEEKDAGRLRIRERAKESEKKDREKERKRERENERNGLYMSDKEKRASRPLLYDLDTRRPP